MKLLVLLLSLSVCSAQASQDTTLAQKDTTLPSQTDTLFAKRDTMSRKVSGVDTVVVYSSSDSIVYSLSTRNMTLFGKGDIQYRQMRLKAEEVDINWDTAIMNARGVPDTSDTAHAATLPAAGKPKPMQQYRGTPVMVDGGEEYRGFKLGYNFKTQKGKIDVGDTEIDGGYYHGEAIKKVARDILFVEDGRYTTCDAPEPHYYFFSPKMKVVTQDKVVAEPVYLYIADVPVFALPFGVFPNKSGRRSGIITPAYGEDSRRGRFLSHLGYYWLINDYMDWNIRGDGYTKGGWALYSDHRYALRYYFSGSISGEYKKLHTGEENDPDRTMEEAYRVNIVHHQDIDPTTRIDANFTFASNNSYLTTNNLQQALEQAIFSNATLSKYWEGTPNNASINVSRSQNLQNGNITEVLPSLSFNRSQSYPFRPSKKGLGFGAEGTETRWYELIGYSYGAAFSNNRARLKTIVSGVQTGVPGLTTTQEEFQRDNRQTLSQNISVNASPKLGYFTITPSVSFQDNRTYTQNFVPKLKSDSSGTEIVKVTDRLAVGSFSSGISASTRFYGIFQPNVFGISSIRHTVNPSLSFTYSKQVYEHDLPPRSMLASFNVGNLFEMKTAPEFGDTATEGKKIQLLNLGAGISYNFAADSLNFSEIGLSFRTDIANVVNISGNSNFNLYKFDESIGRPVNKFLINEEGRLARMTSFGINLSTTLSGERQKREAPPTGAQLAAAEEDTTGTVRGQGRPSGYYGVFSEEEPDLSIPWSLTLAWDFTESKVPNARSRRSNVHGSLSFNLTENWKISVSGSYDMINKELAAPSVTIYRDLHCWEMNFNWIPLGTYRSFNFEIRIKAPQLHDIKITKQRSSRSIY